MHKSVRGIIKKDEGIILIHRLKTREDGYIRDYYVVPGGKMELGESEEDTVKREVYEELGITVEPERKLLEYKSDYDDSIQIFYLCKYLDGIVGSGTGPEITNKSEYKGSFNPEIVKIEEISNINLVPEGIKDFLSNKKALFSIR